MTKTSVNRDKNGQYKTTIPKAIGDGFDLDGVKLEWSAESGTRLVATIVDEDDRELATDGGRPSPFNEPDTFDCPECGIGVYPSMGRCLNCGWEGDEDELRTDGGVDSDASHTCPSCGESFGTLTKKRLHQRDECPVIDDEVDTSDMDIDQIADVTVSELAICDVCGEYNEEFDDYDHDVTDAGVTITLIFQCAFCGAQNRNEAILS